MLAWHRTRERRKSKRQDDRTPRTSQRCVPGETLKNDLRTMFGSGRAGHARCVCHLGRVKSAM
nr:MAG TPA: hypothetical protein [Caudoviricetes sp.]